MPRFPRAANTTHVYPWATTIFIGLDLLQIPTLRVLVARVTEGPGQSVSWTERSGVVDHLGFQYWCDRHCHGWLEGDTRRCPIVWLVFAI